MARFDTVFQNSGVKKPDSHPRRETKWIHYTKIKDNHKQYRSSASEEEIKNLAALIEADGGVLQDLLVRKTDADEYEAIAGHHRRDACRYLVEVKNLPQYAFLPCIIETLSDVRAEFQLYSSNGFMPKNDYEKMHELERMKYLLENYPEEFPNLQTGRMVERLAKQLNMKKTTVGEYLTISKNLGDKGKEAFKEGALKKSAAVEMSSLPKEEQDKLIERGITEQKEIKAYKEKKEPSDTQIRTFYDVYLKEYDTDRSKLKEVLVKEMRHCGGAGCGVMFQCTPRGVRLDNEDEITWARLVQRINELYPVKEVHHPEPKTTASGAEKEESLQGQLRVVNTDMDIEEEDVPDSGTQKAQEDFSPKAFLEEQKARLNTLLRVKEKGDPVPEVVLERQKTIVGALASMVSDLEMSEIKNKTEKLVQPPLPVLRNDDERKQWLRSFEDWGVWYTDNHIGATYYKYDFENGTRLIAVTYAGSPHSGHLHLVGGPKKREHNAYGMPKYPYHSIFSLHEDSETELVQFLKAVQKK